MSIEYWTSHPEPALAGSLVAGLDTLTETFARDDAQYLVAIGLSETELLLLKSHGIILITTDGTLSPDNRLHHLGMQMRQAGYDVPASAFAAVLLATPHDAGDGWYDIAAPETLPQVCYSFRDPGTFLSGDELRTLLRDTFSMKPKPAEMPPSSKEWADVQTGSSADWFQRRMPLLIEHRPALEDTPGPEETLTCLPCRYHPTRVSCDVGVLRGEVRHIDASEKEPAHLTLATAAGKISLTVHTPWRQLAKPLRLAGERGDRRPVVLAYHLHKMPNGGLRADDRSLIIVEPDWLINARALVDADYCGRSYFLSRFAPRTPSPAAIRGNVVHHLFEEMVTRVPTERTHWQQAIDAACRNAAPHLALLDMDPEQFFQERIRPILARLYRWHQNETLPAPTGRSETFLLAPQVGLKGRIDALWETAGNVWVGELKTGKPWGTQIRLGDEMQLAAYVLMALARGWAQPEGYQAFVLYPNGEDDHPVRLDARLNPSVFQQVVIARNRVVLIDYLGWGPYERERRNKCVHCFAAERCEATTALLDHTDTRPWPDVRDRFGYAGHFDRTTKRWFQRWNDILHQELITVKASHAALWAMTPEAREGEGTTLLLGKQQRVRDLRSRQSGVQYTFDVDNRSELRAGDYVLVSEAPGPLAGRMADAQVISIDETSISLLIDEPLEFAPQVVDQYTSEYLLMRQFVPLWHWMQQPPARRDIVIRHRPSRQRERPAPLHYEPVVSGRPLNQRQQAALERLTQTLDYLLIQGPPGTGKTTLIAALVRECLARGERVLLAAGTNTAVDNVVLALRNAGLRDEVVRLGNPLRVREEVAEHLPEALAAHDALGPYVRRLRKILTDTPVLAATASTWSRGTWDGANGESPLQFDVVIVDEAGQLTAPATLAPLRFAPRFVLIGDHKQLPPVVQSEGRRRMSDPDPIDIEAGPRLSRSLFEELIVADAAETPASQEYGVPLRGKATVMLTEQYRMNAEICRLASDRWYDSRLRPGTQAVATARLTLPGSLPADPLAHVRDPDTPVVWIDVPLRVKGPPRQNQREANLIVEILAGYRDAGLTWDQVGIIAPFRAQVAAIRRTLVQRLGNEVRATARSVVDTVDRFQGQERDLIIVSLCAYDHFVPDLLRDERRLNVAVTRARHKLILLGDTAVLRQEPVYAALLREIEGIAGARLVSHGSDSLCVPARGESPF